jgi:hypothetical protein
LACNVGFGLPHGWPCALLSGWPAVAFVGSAEVANSMSRKRSPRAHDRQPSPTVKRRPPAASRTSAADSDAAVMAALAADPAMTTGQLAASTGLSDRTVRRVRARPNGASTS